MSDTFSLYRRAQKFLALEIDEAIDPRDYGEDEASEAELLIAELASGLAEAAPSDPYMAIFKWPLTSLRDATVVGPFEGEDAAREYAKAHWLKSRAPWAVIPLAHVIQKPLRSRAVKPTSRERFREIIAEEFSYFIGKACGMRPCGDNASPAEYYAQLPPEMKVHCDVCVDRIAARLTGQSPVTGDKLA